MMLPIKLRVSVKINTPTLERLRQLGEGNTDVDTSSLSEGMAAIYRAFAKRRFIQQSKGGGDWPPLAAMRKRNYDQALKQSRKVLRGSQRNKSVSDAEKVLATAMHNAMSKKYKPWKFNRD